MQESTVDAVDVALLQALEHDPEATWEALASVLSIDASTAKRRWGRLRELGFAWVSCYPLISAEHGRAIVEVQCSSGSAVQTAKRIANDPQALFVDVTAGSADIILTVVAPSTTALSHYLLETLPKIPGVLKTTSYPIVQVDLAGEQDALRHAHFRASERATQPVGAVRHVALIQGRFKADALDWAICSELSKDARQPARAIADALGVGATTVRRRIEGMKRAGAYHLKVGASPHMTGNRVGTWFSARIPPRSRSAVVDALVCFPNIMQTASVAGRNNLIFEAMFQHLADIDEFEVRLARMAPELEIKERKVVLRPIRQMSRILNEEGCATQAVSVDIRNVR